VRRRIGDDAPVTQPPDEHVPDDTVPDDTVPDDTVPEPSAEAAPDASADAAGVGAAPSTDGVEAPADAAADAGQPAPDPAPAWAPSVTTPQTWGAPDNAFAPTYTPYVPAGGAPATTSAKAITSLVLSIVWLCGLGSLIAVILGHLARGDIKRSQGRVGGRGLATAGLVIGYLGLAFTLVIGGAVAVQAIDDGVGTSRQSEGRDGSVDDPPDPSASEPPRQVQPVTGVCPDVAALTKIVPPGTNLVLFNSTRGVEDGVIECLYTADGRSPAQAPYVLVALQDDVTTLSVEDYFTERELDPPTPEQLGAAQGTADRFGYDSYDSPGSNIPYIDTGAARGNRSAVLSVPASFNILVPVLFTTTVELLDGIRVPNNVI
jgi:hypothetical protein